MVLVERNPLLFAFLFFFFAYMREQSHQSQFYFCTFDATWTVRVPTVYTEEGTRIVQYMVGFAWTVMIRKKVFFPFLSRGSQNYYLY